MAHIYRLTRKIVESEIFRKSEIFAKRTSFFKVTDNRTFLAVRLIFGCDIFETKKKMRGADWIIRQGRMRDRERQTNKNYIFPAHDRDPLLRPPVSIIAANCTYLVIIASLDIVRRE